MNIIKSLIFLNILLISFNVSASSWITKKGENFDKIPHVKNLYQSLELNKKSDYFIDNEKYEKAFSCSIIAANQKDTYAEGAVGWFYQNGYGVKKIEKALEYLRRAKNGGSAYAMNLLANHYVEEMGASKKIIQKP